MSKFWAIALVTILALAAGPIDAHAFGDTCRKDVSARGSVQGSMSKARNAAIAAWETKAARQHGSRYANWYYSGDRTIDCSWDATGRRIQCTAIAGPCGRNR